MVLNENTDFEVITARGTDAFVKSRGAAGNGRRAFVAVVLLLLSVVAVRGQYDVSFSHYFDMEGSFNPAAIGKKDCVNIGAAYAMDLAGFKHNPNTMYIGADMPFYFLNMMHGGGVQLLNDRLGFFTHQRVSLQYSLKRDLFGGKLGIGLQLGMLSESFDGSKVGELEDPNDPVFMSASAISGNAFDVGAGIYYSHGRWYVGVSAQHLTAPLVELGEKNELKIDRTYYLTGGYNIKLRNPFITIPTSVLVRSDMVGYRADVTARLVYTTEKKHLYVGASYSPTNSVTVLIGGTFNGVNAGYSYEMYTSAINPGNGSHELFVGYQTDLNMTKKGKNKHKSVRYL